MAATTLADLTFIFLLLALSGPPQPRWSLESLERDIAEFHRRETITLDDDIRALLAVRLGTDWIR